MSTLDLATAVVSSPPAPVRPRVWTVFVAYLLVFVTAMVLSVLAVGVAYAVQAVLSGAKPTPPESMQELPRLFHRAELSPHSPR